MTAKVKEQKKERVTAEINKKKKELSRLANSLFNPVGKNPYYLNRGSSSIAIKNMAELLSRCSPRMRLSGSHPG